MKKVCFLNGSPQGINSTSFLLIKEMEQLLPDQQFQQTIVNIAACTQQPENIFQSLLAADSLIIVFPLFYYALPGLLVRFLEDYSVYATAKPHNASVYAVINCGFPEPEHNHHAAHMIKCFSDEMHLEWRFALEIGCGPMLKSTRSVPMKSFLKKELYQGIQMITNDIKTPHASAPANILAKPKFPSWLYRFTGTLNWKQEASKYNLTSKDLEKTPYL